MINATVIARQAIVDELSDAPDLWTDTGNCPYVALDLAGRQVRAQMLCGMRVEDLGETVQFHADPVNLWTTLDETIAADGATIYLRRGVPLARIDFGGRQEVVGAWRIVWDYHWAPALPAWLLRMLPAKYRRFERENVPTLFRVEWHRDGIMTIKRRGSGGGPELYIPVTLSERADA